ncbi:MAG: hypothetical protein INR71_00175 [Terriglobus roseus]|nr:hypothetical protein [Terriglobus roseus]
MLLERGGAARLPAECLCFAGVIVGVVVLVPVVSVVAPFARGALFGGCGKEPMLTVFLTARSEAGVVGVAFSFPGVVDAVGMPDVTTVGLGFLAWRDGSEDADGFRMDTGGTREAPEPRRECGVAMDDDEDLRDFDIGIEGSGDVGGPSEGRDGRGSVEVAMVPTLL